MKNRIVTFGKRQCFYSPMKISRLRSLIKTEKRKYDINIYIYGLHVSMYLGEKQRCRQTERGEMNYYQRDLRKITRGRIMLGKESAQKAAMKMEKKGRHRK